MREDRGRNEFYIDDYGVLFGLIAAKCEEQLGEYGRLFGQEKEAEVRAESERNFLVL